MSVALLSRQGEAWYDGPSIKRETHLLKHQSTHTTGLYQEDKPLHKTICTAWYGNNAMHRLTRDISTKLQLNYVLPKSKP